MDSVRFDDTGSSSTVNVTTDVQPSAVVVHNDVVNYTFTGPGKIGGPASLTKEGAGTLTIANSGTNDFFGPITINGGSVQVGNNGPPAISASARLSTMAGCCSPAAITSASPALFPAQGPSNTSAAAFLRWRVTAPLPARSWWPPAH